MQMTNHQVRPGTRGWIQTTVITGEITVLFARRHEQNAASITTFLSAADKERSAAGFTRNASSRISLAIHRR